VAKATQSSRIYCKLGLRKRAAAYACTMSLEPLSPPISEACCMRQPDAVHLACTWRSTITAWAAGVLRCDRRRGKGKGAGFVSKMCHTLVSRPEDLAGAAARTTTPGTCVLPGWRQQRWRKCRPAAPTRPEY
jgi:hypothetical protein